MAGKRKVFTNGSVLVPTRLGHAEKMALDELAQMMGKSKSYVFNCAIGLLYNNVNGYTVLADFPIVEFPAGEEN